MKKSDTGFKILTVTLSALVITGMVHRFTYSAFVMARAGQIYWYNWELWKQYWTWLPGKSICIILALLIAALIIEAVCFIFSGKKKT